MKIAFVHFPGRVARLASATAGDAPTEFLFGAVELERAGHEISHYEVDPRAPVSRLSARLVDQSAGRGLLPPHLGAASLRGTYQMIRQLRGADVVVASTTATAMALATWRGAGLLRTPVVGIVAGLVNQPWRRPRRRTTVFLLRRMHAVLYGEGELAPLLQRAPTLGDRIHVNAFGVDTAFWTPAPEAAVREVLAIGNDGHRDWETLVRAAADIPAPVRIFTRHQRPADLPANVNWAQADWHRQLLSDADVRQLYRRASVVVVPVQDVPQPSGQSVTLQAMACGRPVVLSRTRGLWRPETLHDGVNVEFVPPGDAAALAAAVRDVLDDPAQAQQVGAAGREGVLRDATVDAYAARLERICALAVERP